MTSAYSGGRGKKPQQGTDGSPRRIYRVSFWRKINHLGATNKVKFCCVRLKTKFFEINFQSLTFQLRFWSHSSNNLVPLPAWSKFGQVNSCVKIYSASRNLFVDRLLPATRGRREMLFDKHASQKSMVNCSHIVGN